MGSVRMQFVFNDGDDSNDLADNDEYKVDNEV